MMMGYTTIFTQFYTQAAPTAIPTRNNVYRAAVVTIPVSCSGYSRVKSRPGNRIRPVSAEMHLEPVALLNANPNSTITHFIHSRYASSFIQTCTVESCVI